MDTQAGLARHSSAQAPRSYLVLFYLLKKKKKKHTHTHTRVLVSVGLVVSVCLSKKLPSYPNSHRAKISCLTCLLKLLPRRRLAIAWTLSVLEDCPRRQSSGIHSLLTYNTKFWRLPPRCRSHRNLLIFSMSTKKKKTHLHKHKCVLASVGLVGVGLSVEYLPEFNITS